MKVSYGTLDGVGFNRSLRVTKKVYLIGKKLIRFKLKKQKKIIFFFLFKVSRNVKTVLKPTLVNNRTY